MKNTNNKGNLIGAVVIGAAIGGVLGIFFASYRGNKTRNTIPSKSHDLTDAVKDKFNKVADKFRKEVDAIKDQANDLAQNSNSMVENFK